MKYRPYFTLLARDDVRSMWRIEFGSVHREDVVFERDDYMDKGSTRVNLLIIVTHDSQAAIQERVDMLNEHTARRVRS